MIYKHHLREVIARVLHDMDLYSDAAVELLMLTAAVESDLGTYLKQMKGPARGIFQMEPATEKDIWENYLKYKPAIKKSVLAYIYNDQADSELELMANIPYQVAMARVHYLRVKEKMPNGDDVESLAAYWKNHYNTHLGKGTVKKAVGKYEEYCR